MKGNDYNIILESIINDIFDEVKLFLYNQLEDYKASSEFMKNEKSNTKEVYLISNQRSLKDTRLYAYQNRIYFMIKLGEHW